MTEVYLGILAQNPPQFLASESVPYPGQPLVLGSSGDAVRLIQERLSYISGQNSAVTPVEPTGYFGEQTVASVNSFLAFEGLPQKGFVGPGTWQLIENEYLNLRNGEAKTAGQSPGYAVKGE